MSYFGQRRVYRNNFQSGNTDFRQNNNNNSGTTTSSANRNDRHSPHAEAEDLNALNDEQDPAWRSPNVGAVSKSYFKPRTLHGYTQALSTIRQQGELELNIDDDSHNPRRNCVEEEPAGSTSRGTSRTNPPSARQVPKHWTKYWFDLERDELLWFLTKEDAQIYKEFDDSSLLVGSIPLDKIVKVSVTSQREDSLSIAVRHIPGSPAIKYNLRAANKTERNLWLHSFHKCVAWLITTITRRQLRAKSSSQGTKNDGRLGSRQHSLQTTSAVRTPNAFDKFNFPNQNRTQPRIGDTAEEFERTIFQRQLTVDRRGDASHVSSPRDQFLNPDGDDDHLFGELEFDTTAAVDDIGATQTADELSLSKVVYEDDDDGIFAMTGELEDSTSQPDSTSTTSTTEKSASTTTDAPVSR